PRPRRERRLVEPAGRGDWRDDVETVQARTVRQEIWLEPMDTDVLFGASIPRVYEFEAPPARRRHAVQRNDEIRLHHGSTLHYEVWSELVPPSPEVLRAAQGPR